MKKYRYLLFDLDGTLTYSHRGIYNCIRYALSCLGKPEPSERRLRTCIGPPLSDSFVGIFGLTEEDAAKAVQKYRERYAKIGIDENEPIPGAAEMLKKLWKAGYRQAIATSKPYIFAKRISDRFGFTDYLESIAGSGIDGSFPTKADVIEEAIGQLSAEREYTLMIGDRKYDAEGARTAGVDFAGLDVGYADRGELAAESPKYLFTSFRALTDFLL